MTLPRILSAVGRTLAVLGAVMLLFVVFQLWGTGLQQAQAQSNLEGDLAERFRLAAEAGQAARRGDPVPPPAAAPEGPDPAGVTAPDTAAAPATGVDGAAPQATATESGDGPAKDPERPGSGDGGATAGEPRVAPGAGASAPDAGADDPAVGIVTVDSSLPAPLPDLPSMPRVVSHVSELAAARATERLLDPDVEELLPLVYPEAGEAIARIIIPSIEVDSIVVAGVDIEDLRKGPGHFSTTPLPGQPGNAAIAGHRTTYGAPFGRLAELNAGDAIIVETLQGRFTYRVLPGQPGMAGHALGFRIVAPTALEVLDDKGDNRLTLTSCHPKYSSKKRIIVHAALVGDPVVRLPRPGEPVGAEFVQLAQPGGAPPVPPNAAAPQAPTPETIPSEPETIPSEPIPPGTAVAAEGEQAGGSPGTAPGDSGQTHEAQEATTAADRTAPRPAPAPVTSDGFGEGLSGDRDAILPAVLWGLAAAAVWVLGRMFGRSGRRALRYTVAAVPSLVVIYVMFSYVDRALPAY